MGGIEDQALAFKPEAVRALMAEHPNLLVILDNVWSLDAIKPLREALPPGTHHIITTRSLEIMRHAGGATHEVGLLSDSDALALVKLRLGWQPEPDSDDAAWVGDLIARLGRHPLALDIALGLMASEGLEPAEWRETAQRVVNQVRSGSNFGDLKLPQDIDRDANVEAALIVSYEFLDAAAQSRFRRLGAMAPEAGFSLALAAAVWQCDEAAARAQLMAFYNRSLLERRDGGAWGQHAILRGYALLLLRREGEYEAAAARHAEAYDDAMRAADVAQRYHEMLPAYAQVTHAFEWAIDNDLDRALNLIGNSANLQAQFGKARDGFHWSRRALGAAQARGTAADVARAQGTLANALARAAGLPGEDRRARLLDALAAYDAALQHYRPDTAPLDYAATQNNRANLLRDLAGLPGEDRRARLLDALAAYDAALQFRRPDTAPLAYAATQNNRAVLLRDLAGLPGEDRRGHLIEALRCSVEAIGLFEQYQQAQYLETGKRVLNGLREACGNDFADLWLAAGLGEPPDWLMRDSQDQQDAPGLAALQQRLRGAGVTDEASLHTALERDPELKAAFETFFAQQDPEKLAQAVLATQLNAFAHIQTGEQLLEFWRAMPSEMEAPFISAVEGLIAEAEKANDAYTVRALQERLSGFKTIRERAQQPDPLQAALATYLEQREQAAQAESDAAAWQRAADAGEGLLSLLGTAPVPSEQVDALKADIADTYNSLGNALDESDKRAALAAFERAIALQPGFAMWHRNRAGMLIELGELGELDEAAIAHARELEPDAPRLAELDAQLAELDAQLAELDAQLAEARIRHSRASGNPGVAT